MRSLISGLSEKQGFTKSELREFEKRVYRAVLSIPFGQVRSYKWVAKRAGRPAAFRAVGQILKRNPYPLIVPCHRVINNNGKLGGYRWGIKAKQRILLLEKNLRAGILPTKNRKR